MGESDEPRIEISDRPYKAILLDGESIEINLSGNYILFLDISDVPLGTNFYEESTIQYSLGAIFGDSITEVSGTTFNYTPTFGTNSSSVTLTYKCLYQDDNYDLSSNEGTIELIKGTFTDIIPNELSITQKINDIRIVTFQSNYSNTDNINNNTSYYYRFYNEPTVEDPSGSFVDYKETFMGTFDIGFIYDDISNKQNIELIIESNNLINTQDITLRVYKLFTHNVTNGIPSGMKDVFGNITDEYLLTLDDKYYKDIIIHHETCITGLELSKPKTITYNSHSEKRTYHISNLFCARAKQHYISFLKSEENDSNEVKATLLYNAMNDIFSSLRLNKRNQDTIYLSQQVISYAREYSTYDNDASRLLADLLK